MTSTSETNTTLTSLTYNNAGSHSVIVSNSLGFVESQATAVLNVLPMILTSDGDGLPDDWESAHDLIMNDAADAALDTA